MENKKLGWAIVGLGKFATEQIIPAFQDCKHSELVALVSGSPEKARQIAAEHHLNPANIYNYQNYDALKDNPAVDVIYIILPNGLHAEYTVRGARAGKHIMCEKPMATSIAEGQEMIAACKQADKKLMVAYRAQYETYNQKCMELIRDGKIGQVRLITSDHGRPLKPDQPEDKWRANKKLAGGGSLMDIGIYSLQAARYLTGEEPTEIFAMQSSTPNDPRFKEVEENITFSLRFPGGVLANCSSSYGFHEVKRFQVFGSAGNITLDPATDYHEHRLLLTTDAGTEEIKLKGNNHFAAEIDHLSSCILENKMPLTPGEEGLQDVKLMMAIYESAARSQSIIIT